MEKSLTGQIASFATEKMTGINIGDVKEMAKDSVKSTAGTVKSIASDIATTTLPKELQPFRGAVEELLRGNMFKAVLLVITKLLPLVAIALAIIIMAFCIKWWLGLLAIPFVAGWLVWRVVKIIIGIKKFVYSLPGATVRKMSGLIDDIL